MLAEDQATEGPPAARRRAAPRRAACARRSASRHVDGAGVTVSVGVASLPGDGTHAPTSCSTPPTRRSRAAIEAGGDRVALRPRSRRSAEDELEDELLARPPRWTTDVRRVSTWLVGLALAVFVRGRWRSCRSRSPRSPASCRAGSRWPRRPGCPASACSRSPSRSARSSRRPAEPRCPRVVDGRPGFDAAAVSHLVDVRRVIAAARLLTWVLALVLAVGLALEVARRRTRPDRRCAARGRRLVRRPRGARARSRGLLDFDTFFSAFHGLFFAAGTWTFASDSLLIQTFPEPFWATAAAVWAALVLAGRRALCARRSGAAAALGSRSAPTNVAPRGLACGQGVTKGADSVDFRAEARSDRLRGDT